MWEDGRLVHSLSLSPDEGVIEDRGEPLFFERPFWTGDRPADVIPWPHEENKPYPLPSHPLDLGEEALRGLFGFVQDGMPQADDIAAAHITLHGLAVHASASRCQGRAAFNEERYLLRSLDDIV